MADSVVVGILRALLTADTAQWESGFKKAAAGPKAAEKAVESLSGEVKKLTPQAERMVKAFQGDKLLYKANNLVAAVSKMGGASKLTDTELKRVNGTLNEAIAKYKAMGQAAPKALLDTERATRSAAGPTQFLSAKMVALSAAAGVMVTQLAGRAVRAVVDFGKEAFRSAGQIVDLSSKTGLGTKTIQEMQFVAEQTGTSLEAMTGAAFKLGVRIAGGGDSVRDAVQKLGLSLEQLQSMRPDQMWNTVIDALGRYENAQERNRLGVVLFGRSFEQVAGSVSEGYRGIADQAKVATDAQLRELERLGDEWTKFRKNLVTGFAAAMGEVVLRNRIAGELMREQLQPGGTQLTQGQFSAEVERRMLMNLNLKAKDIQLTAEQATATRTYAQQLAEVRAQLAKLTPAQRAEIDAALELGINTDDLEDKFGLAEGTLRLYTAQLKEAESASKKLTKSQAELAKELEENNRRWLDILGTMDRAKLVQESEFRKAQTTDDVLLVQPVIDTEMESLDALGRILDEKRREDATYRQYRNDIGERMMEDERQRMDRELAFRQRYLTLFRQGLGNVGGAISSNLFSTFIGGGNPAAKAAREDYERLRKSGTASAEAITEAFRRMQQEQHGFLQRFTGWTRGILSEFKRLIDDMIGMWVHELLGGMMRSLAKSALGQKVTGWLGGAIPGLAPALGMGGAAALPGAAAAPSLAALGLGAAPGTAAAGGTTAAAGGLGLGFAAAIAAPVALALFGLMVGAGAGGRLRMDAWQRGDSSAPNVLGRIHKDTFLALARHKSVGSFRFGGFVPPNTTMPAILHGGSHGEAIVPMDGKGSINTGVVHHHTHHWKVSTIDGRTTRQFFRSPAATSSIAHIVENNTGFVATRIKRGLDL